MMPVFASGSNNKIAIAQFSGKHILKMLICLSMLLSNCEKVELLNCNKYIKIFMEIWSKFTNIEYFIIKYYNAWHLK